VKETGFLKGLAVGATAGAIGTVGAVALSTLLKPVSPPMHAPELPTTPSQRKNITFVSTWEVKCGIAEYTRCLIEGIRKVESDVDCRVISHDRVYPHSTSDLVHVQNEYGVAPPSAKVNSVRAPLKITTFHTVHKLMASYHRDWDRITDAYIVHSEEQRKLLSSMVTKPVYVIPHGSKIFDPIPKNEARRRLGLPLNKTILYSHGMASKSKGYEGIILAVSRIPDTILIINSSITFDPKHVHDSENYVKKCMRYKNQLGLGNRVIFLRKWLDDESINLYASASDILIFNYHHPPPPAGLFTSTSGALHRVLSAGKPVVCAREDPRLWELQEKVHALKFRYGDADEIGFCIRRLIEDKVQAYWLGKNCRRLAYKTSWELVAVRHLEVYDIMWVKIVG